MLNPLTFYLDNFRGFSETYFELKDVNFLVGENSSGKTSLLTAIRVIADPQLWSSPQSTTKIAGSNHYSDFVSATSQDKSTFSLGMIWELKQPAKNSSHTNEHSPAARFVALLLVFKDDKGQPGVGQCHFQVDDFRCSIVLKRKSMQVHVDENVRVPDDASCLFQDWTQWPGDQSKPLITKRQIGFPLYYAILDAITQYERSTIDAGGAKLDPTRRRSRVMSELMSLANEIAWIAPIRTKPKRTYDEFSLEYSSEGEHTPYLIKELLARRTQASQFRKFLADIGRKSGLFQSINILRYGKGETAPFELDVVLDSDPLGINNVGYGVSQSLPIFVELFARSELSWFAIQQPEVHLHPKAQAAIGELIYEMCVNESKRFVIETHSDYLIDRFRRMKKNGGKREPDAQIVYFERKDGKNIAYPMDIAQDGTLPSDQPEGYRKFFVNEALAVLDLG
jgi:predicted ATPase